MFRDCMAKKYCLPIVVCAPKKHWGKQCSATLLPFFSKIRIAKNADTRAAQNAENVDGRAWAWNAHPYILYIHALLHSSPSGALPPYIKMKILMQAHSPY